MFHVPKLKDIPRLVTIFLPTLSEETTIWRVKLTGSSHWTTPTPAYPFFSSEETLRRSPVSGLVTFTQLTLSQDLVLRTPFIVTCQCPLRFHLSHSRQPRTDTPNSRTLLVSPQWPGVFLLFDIETFHDLVLYIKSKFKPYCPYHFLIQVVNLYYHTILSIPLFFLVKCRSKWR